MKTYPRSDRVGEHIHRVLADVLRRDVHDPRLTGTTITQVKMSPDLRDAHVYFTLSGQKNTPKQAIAGFSTAMGYIKKTLAKELGLRYMPNLRFSYDTTLDRALRIEEILKKNPIPENGESDDDPKHDETDN